MDSILMADIFNTVKSRLPTGVKDALKGTVVEDIYRHKTVASLRGRHVALQRISVNSPAGRLELSIPESAGPYRMRNTPGGYEPAFVSALADDLTRQTVYYDVGAGYGYNCVVAETVGVDSANIHGFEADHFRYPILTQNLNRASHAVKAFVDRISDDKRLALDDYLSQSKPPDIITIDVEGGEYDVLFGAQQLLASYRPVLYVELHPELLPSHITVTDLFEFLRSFGYELTATDHRKRKQEWAPATVTELPLNRSTPSPTCMLRAD